MEHIYPVFDTIVSREERERYFNQKAKAFWLTGLSGSGKTTIARKVERRLFNEGYFVQIIDGDNVRSGLCNNLGFSLEDRAENIRRVAELTALYLKSGIICINCFVSPTIEIRNLAKESIGEDFYEIFINTPLEICETRDPKGLYKKARNKEIQGFTGIDSPFEAPVNPSLEIKTAKLSVEESAQILYDYILHNIKLN